MGNSSLPGGDLPQPRAESDANEEQQPARHPAKPALTTARPSDPTSQRIDADDERTIAEWAQKFDTTAQQLREAIAAVGDLAADVEMHLKGSHSTTNADRVEEAGDA